MGNCSFRPMTNTPTARAASSTPAISDSRGRNSGLAALEPTIRMMVESAMPTDCTIAPNSTTLPSTTTVGRHFQWGSGGPFRRSARSARIAPSTIKRAGYSPAFLLIPRTFASLEGSPPGLRREILELLVEPLRLQPLLQLRLHLVERRYLGGTLVFDQDHMPAELRLHGLRREFAL